MTCYHQGGSGPKQRDCNEEKELQYLEQWGTRKSVENMKVLFETMSLPWAARMGVFQAAGIFSSRTDGGGKAK